MPPKTAGKGGKGGKDVPKGKKPMKPKDGAGGKAKKKKWSKGKVRDKLNNMVLFDQPTYDKLLKEVPQYKVITPSVVSERLKIRASLARKALKELHRRVMLVNQAIAAETARLYLVPYCGHHVEKYHSWMECEELRKATASDLLTYDEELEARQRWAVLEDRLTFILLAKDLVTVRSSSSTASRQGDADSKKPDDVWKEIEVHSMIGDVNLFLINTSDDSDVCEKFEGEISVMIAERDWRGRGLAAEAVCGLLEFTGRHVPAKLSSVVAKISLDNTESLRVFQQKMGFVERSRCQAFNQIMINSMSSDYEVRHLICSLANAPHTPYEVTINTMDEPSEIGMMARLFESVLRQMAETLKITDMKNAFNERFKILESRLSIDNARLVELDRLKLEMQDIREQIRSKNPTGNNNESLKNIIPGLRLNRDGIKTVELNDDQPLEKYTLTQSTMDYLKKPTFAIWNWESNEISIQINYRNNPFHNFRHCFCVAQMMYGMLHLCGLADVFSREELGILLTAAVCHDLDHPGYSNSYQINARTQLAIRYNDISPLENHHCAVALGILNNPETNIFANVPPEVFRRTRQGMTGLILATDMAKHGEILETMKRNVEEGFNLDKKEHRETLKMVLIKCCDISNEVRPLSVSEPWVDCLLEEYFNQSDREKEEGLPVAPFMDREKVTKSSAQIGFIKFVLIPMFQTLAKVYPIIDELMVTQLKSALERYEKLQVEEEERKRLAVTLTEAD